MLLRYRPLRRVNDGFKTLVKSSQGDDFTKPFAATLRKNPSYAKTPLCCDGLLKTISLNPSQQRLIFRSYARSHWLIERAPPTRLSVICQMAISSPGSAKGMRRVHNFFERGRCEKVFSNCDNSIFSSWNGREKYITATAMPVRWLPYLWKDGVLSNNILRAILKHPANPSQLSRYIRVTALLRRVNEGYTLRRSFLKLIYSTHR